jgi:hypothetical protein
MLLAARTAGLAAQTPPRDPHAVQPQRPSVAMHAGTVAAGWLEIEGGSALYAGVVCNMGRPWK